MFLSLLGKLSGIALLGGAVIGTPILVTELKTQEDSPINHHKVKVTKQHCEVFMNLTKDSGKGDDTEDNFYLLACKTEDNSPNKAIFQLVKKGENTFREVKSFSAKKISNVQITITYKEGNPETETMNSSLWQYWDTINDQDLKENCTVDWSSNTGVRQLNCGPSQIWSLAIWNN